MNNKSGHLEKGLYYCHKCSNTMTEIELDVFNCISFDNKDDTRKYNFIRPHKNISDNIKFKSSNNIDDDLSDFFDYSAQISFC